MRIVFFSDAHGNQYSLRAFFERLNGISYDKLIFGGDIFGYYYGAKDVIKLLRKYNVQCLLGNHDQMFLDLIDGKIGKSELIGRYGNSYKDIEQIIDKSEVQFLRSLESFMTFCVDGIYIAFAHGSIEQPLEGRVYPDTLIKTNSLCGYDYVFLGHTHHKMIRNIQGTIVVNPGSIGQQRDGKGCSFVVFDTELREIEFETVKYEIKPLEDEIKARDTGEMQNRLIEVLYRKTD